MFPKIHFNIKMNFLAFVLRRDVLLHVHVVKMFTDLRNMCFDVVDAQKRVPTGWNYSLVGTCFCTSTLSKYLQI